MLFRVQMTVRLPHDMPAAQADALKAREKGHGAGAVARRRQFAAGVKR